MGTKPQWNAVKRLGLDLDVVKKAFCKLVVMEDYCESDLYNAMAKELGVTRREAKEVIYSCYFLIPHSRLNMASARISTLEVAKERAADFITVILLDELIQNAQRSYDSAYKLLTKNNEVY